MAIAISRGTSDTVLESFIRALQPYEADHPEATIHLYRQNPACIRVRIVDPSFEGHRKSERHARVWSYLDALDEETQSELSSLTLVTPEEQPSSPSSLLFDDPIPFDE